MSLQARVEHPRGAVVFFYVMFSAALLAFAYTLWDYFTDVVLGLLVAGMTHPLYRRLLGELKGRRTLAASAVTMLVAVIAAFPLLWLVTSLVQQAVGAYDLVREALASDAVQDVLHGQGWLGRRVRALFQAFGARYSPSSVRDAFTDGLGVMAGFLTERLNILVTNVFLSIYHFVLILVVLFYGLIDGPQIKSRLFRLSPLPDVEEELIVQKFKDVGIAILFGSGAASVLQGTLAALAMWVAGIPSALFWGAIVAIFAFVPMVGTNVVIVPATLYLLYTGSWVTALLFFAFTNLQGVVIDNLVTPRLMGGRMRMHNLLIFLALLGGISTFGVGGLIYGPLLAALVLTLADLYERVYRLRLFSGRHSLVP
jgi:predicted PurR-regulated permease PerM